MIGRALPLVAYHRTAATRGTDAIRGQHFLWQIALLRQTPQHITPSPRQASEQDSTMSCLLLSMKKYEDYVCSSICAGRLAATWLVVYWAECKQRRKVSANCRYHAHTWASHQYLVKSCTHQQLHTTAHNAIGKHHCCTCEKSRPSRVVTAQAAVDKAGGTGARSQDSRSSLHVYTHQQFSSVDPRTNTQVPTGKVTHAKLGDTEYTQKIASRDRSAKIQRCDGTRPTFLNLRPKRCGVHHLRDPHVQQLLRRMADRRRLFLQLRRSVANGSCRSAPSRTGQGERFQCSASSSSEPHPSWTPAGGEAQYLKNIILK